MAINPLKALLFTGGGVVAASGAAYVSGALDPLFAPPPPAEVAMVPPAKEPAAEPAVSPGTEARVQPPAEAAAPAEPAAAPAASAPATEPAAATPPAAEAAQPTLPTFDVVRVEGDGSVVIAGNAAPKAKVEVLDGQTVLGATDSGPDGAFAIVLDTPLKPGDYQITLRATGPDGAIAASAQTAVVSIPEKPDGQVLAMVEEPGKPSELMAVPEPDKKPEAPVETAQETPQAPAAAEEPAAAETQAAPAPAETAEPAQEPAQAEAKPVEEKPAEPAAPAVAAAKITVEAVEIDGDKIFVAGTADPGRAVRAYANEILLGDAKTSPDGHFLVEAAHDLPVGTYTVRVDALDADGVKVVARAAVPFEREPGQAVAAVAPAEAAKPAAEQPAGTAAAEKPAEAPAVPADGVPETVSPKLQHADSAVIIRRHDTLWRISRRVYGHGTRYSTIYLANQDQISDPDKIWPGQVFKLPETSREGEPADLKALGDQMTTRPAKTE